MKRCPWNKLDTSLVYQQYHDEEWGVPSYDDHHLFEMLILESFHCGLSWLIILNKRDAFRKAFDNFDPMKISLYKECKIEELLNNHEIVRNKLKIMATIDNAMAFLRVQAEYGSFSNYLWSFTQNQIIYPTDEKTHTTNELSDTVSKYLKRRRFKFMGSVTTYSYLEAVGVMNNHTKECFKYNEQMKKETEV